MKKGLRWKIILSLAVVGIAIFLATPLREKIHLGLDLKGGSHLVLQVQVQDAVKADADQTMERLKEDLRKQSVTWASMDRNDPQKV